MDLYIIRHAESENNARPVEDRIHDPGLTTLGHQQAERLIIRMHHIQPTRILVSPFFRTLETIAPYLKKADATADTWIDLHEQGGVMSGVYEANFEGQPGMTRDEIQTAFPYIQVSEDIDHTGWWKCRPYEALDSTTGRAERVVEQIRNEFAHTEERVALITHGLFMRFMMSALLDIPHAGYDCIDNFTNTSVTKLSITDSHTKLALMNCVRHLPDHWITGADARPYKIEMPAPDHTRENNG
jgi:2,3-bisphosphoglycerate-dependent phosphoglycerate mutase